MSKSNFGPVKAVSFLIGAVVVGLYSSPASAYGSFNGYISDFRYTLIDLDPVDGIAPSISFDPNKSMYFTGVALEGATDNYGIQTVSVGEQRTRADLSRFNIALATAFYGGEFGLPVVLGSSGASDVTENGGHPNSAGDVHAGAYARASFGTAYTLSARSKVVFSMNYTLFGNNPSNSWDSYVTVSASLFAGSTNNSDQRHADFTTSLPNDTFDESGLLSVAASNYTLSSQSGYFDGVVRGMSYDSAAASPVPESATWPLMLVGLLTVATAAKGRARS